MHLAALWSNAGDADSQGVVGGLAPARRRASGIHCVDYGGTALSASLGQAFEAAKRNGVVAC